MTVSSSVYVSSNSLRVKNPVAENKLQFSTIISFRQKYQPEIKEYSEKIDVQLSMKAHDVKMKPIKLNCPQFKTFYILTEYLRK